ncbi:twin-arginine translocase subunit TatC [Halococcus thailandensis]|uniref:Sec-independent protein translocase protein TatC n=1 Tax=Halococcus thailandensis JCM 13552 TaxID=1227457 RepID=M0N5Q3_9EURY|nr:twin-arginine translocase subunit TatC [Halococcus thailandensis]EMA52888.1 Sec-independent periplasmic protein translocase [Halococcus thailandensis JCM 13552]
MSGAVDEDVRRSVARGRETLGALLSAAQTHLQKVAIVFLVAFLGSFYALWLYVWDRLKADLFARLPPAVAKQTSVVATTPFDVPLLQVKIALFVAAFVSLPVLLYYSRDALKTRGYWPRIGGRWKAALVVLIAAFLFVLGAAYGYFVFFPLMFEFLASNSVAVGFQPTYSIVLWAQFILLLSISFGIAAQLPLVMTGLSLSEIVPYETFREKWKYAIIAAFGFGALFSPPDPFTQVLWALPIILLYVLSLGLTRFVVTLQRGGSAVSVRGVVRDRWLRIFGIPTLIAGGVAGAIVAGFGGYFNQVIVPQIPFFTPEEPVFKYIGPLLGLPRDAAIAAVAAAVFLVLVVLALVYYLYRAVESAAAEPGRPDSPATIDVGALDEAGVRAAPAEAFAEMSEEEATAQASMAMSDGDPNKAQAILDRFDDAQTADEDADELDADADQDEEFPDEFEPAVEDQGTEDAAESNALTRTTAGMVDSFTAEETTEEDIGGYYYDIAFVLNSLRSRAFLLFGLFMAVLAGTFIWLSQGGIGGIRSDFLTRLPAAVRPESVGVVELHPVEALVFEIKLSTLLAVLAILPFFLYWAWPALRERGLAGGDRRVLFAWAGAMLASLVGGVAVGYTTVAPTVISWLAADVVGSNMVVAYRISAAGWLVFFTTAGIGLLAMIPVTMVLFHRGGLVLYGAMRNRWREVTVGVFAFTAYVSPRGVFMMFIIGIPIMLCYGLGLGLLWIYTLGGRRTTRSQRESAD